MALYHSKIYGIVQGVGFRPFVARLAARFGIFGSVANKGPFVEIFAQGSDTACQKFFASIEKEPPERAAILRIKIEPLAACAADGAFSEFRIIESGRERGSIFVSPDIATCPKCEQELYNEKNRRYLHPFINCTACGPRLTILTAMPYDRERTSMKDFPMCEACEKEYHDPASRRYDAQPVCCNDCGPEVFLLGEENVRGLAAITRARNAIIEGKIVAIKGIGGFHLACDASNETAVQLLRTRKNRPMKPFAVMAKNLATARREVKLPDSSAEKMLTGHQKPILLLPRQKGGKLAPSVAPGNPNVGLMLPYNPVQLLLFHLPTDGLDEKMPDVLVMTSGNPSGAPICHTDAEARETLLPLADLILTHNRRIRLRADDSVMAWRQGKPYLVRRSRGLAPLPFSLDAVLDECESAIPPQVLGIGGELKNSFTLGTGSLLYPSPYIGDMGDLRTVHALEDSIGLMESLLEIQPQIVACDLHPRYNTRAVAEKLHLPLFFVQHHYAHILSCLAENNFSGEAIGVALDGTGYGTDGTIWGGEILRASYKGFTRLGSILPFQQAGGDRAPREGWRIALALLRDDVWKRHAEKTKDEREKFLRTLAVDRLALCTPEEFTAQNFLLAQNINCVTSTSAGRLFDAVSALLGLRLRSTFEGEAAMALEFAAEAFLAQHPKLSSVTEIPEFLPRKGDEKIVLLRRAADGRFLLDTDILFHILLEGRLAGEAADAIAFFFHATLAQLIAFACLRARKETGLSVVALSGGVFQNLLLLDLTEQQLKQQGFAVLTHSLVPPNDGGISLGQAAAALVHLSHSV